MIHLTNDIEVAILLSLSFYELCEFIFWSFLNGGIELTALKFTAIMNCLNKGLYHRLIYLLNLKFF